VEKRQQGIGIEKKKVDEIVGSLSRSFGTFLLFLLSDLGGGFRNRLGGSVGCRSISWDFDTNE